jgi:hypothetical protein
MNIRYRHCSPVFGLDGKPIGGEWLIPISRVKEERDVNQQKIWCNMNFTENDLATQYTKLNEEARPSSKEREQDEARI